jgi:nicotinamide phosphoribosyltransferase
MTDKNFILDADSYKFSHYALYPEGTDGMHSYISARVKNQNIIPFGLQMWIKKNLSKPITLDDVTQAQILCEKHGVPFNTAGWTKIVTNHGGFLPITIKGIPEGTPIDSDSPFVTVECTDPDVWWLASWIETSLQRGVWYPTTIASNDYKNWKQLKYFYDHSSDADFMLDFSLHSFASRGVSSRETAEVGGLAHLVFFKGTDDVVALEAAETYYSCDMAGFSVVASEHSVQCSYGRDNQKEYLTRLIKSGKPSQIISVVMDGYNIYRETDLLCTPEMVQMVREQGIKIVVRPDSGDMFEVVPILLEKLENAFGVTINSKGKKVLKDVGIIQGDGINSTTMGMLAQKVNDLGYAPECVIYGSGGGLLQQVSRDTYSFAQKTSAIRVNNEWRDTVKDPITDSNKKSKGGRMDDTRFVTFYQDGKILVDDTLDVIRSRATA